MKLLSTASLPNPIQGYTYAAKFSLVGVAESDLMKIRTWLQKEAIRRRK